MRRAPPPHACIGRSIASEPDCTERAGDRALPPAQCLVSPAGGPPPAESAAAGGKELRGKRACGGASDVRAKATYRFHGWPAAAPSEGSPEGECAARRRVSSELGGRCGRS